MEPRMKAKTSKPSKAAAKVKPLTDKDRLELFRMMVRIREFEEEVQRSYLEGLVHGTTHLCQGQEAVSAGTGIVFREDDYIGYTYRGHGVCIARGMDSRRPPSPSCSAARPASAAASAARCTSPTSTRA